jgi:hypothetical protein
MEAWATYCEPKAGNGYMLALSKEREWLGPDRSRLVI